MGNFLFIEPYYGGSHKYFADGLKQYSRHNIDLLTLPDRFWKWRMRGAAVYMAEQIEDWNLYDGIICSNMLSLSDLKGLSGPDFSPAILYFHENQILYPLSEGEAEDLHYGFTDYTSALCADSILFNSNYHRDAFLSALQPFLRRFPDFRPSGSMELIAEKSRVIYPGCRLESPDKPKRKPGRAPVIVWNHRWEHDKNPEDFFETLFELSEEGIDFRLAVLGEKYSRSPAIFDTAESKLRDKIIHFGYAENYGSYCEILKKGDIVISTAYQENYGISVVEAIGAGNFPLLPDRLSYREIIPEDFHSLCLYKSRKDLIKKLKKLMAFYDPTIVDSLAEENFRFSWDSLIGQYDNHFDSVIKKSR